MTESELLALLQLQSVPGMGPGRIRRLLAKFRTPSAVLAARLSELVSVEGIDRILAQKILHESDPAFAETQLEQSQRLGIRLVTLFDADYPQNLKEIPDAPLVLYVKGELLPGDAIALGVVGTRQPSDYGKTAAYRITKTLVEHGFTIVSGLARGIDTIAHQSALKSGGRTLAVLGSGLDQIYPAENKRIAAQISEQGALISEMPCGAGPDAVNFPRRNRIISGISLGVLIVEAGQKSGALITASNALEQGREVFALPGSIFNPKSAGTNRLIKEGAKLVQNVDDILEELDSRIRQFLRRHLPEPSSLPGLSEDERKILHVLSEEPLHIDLISQKTGFSSPQALSILLSLELKDLVRQLAGKMFVRV